MRNYYESTKLIFVYSYLFVFRSQTLITILIFILILGLLVFVHELGHFLLAKRAGAKVEEFGFGFPPRILGVKKGETIYSINAIPLGGFVKIFGEDGNDKTNPRAFGAKKIYQRLAILAAGVLMNFLLAAVLLGLGYFIGLPQAISDSDAAESAMVQISFIAPSSPAESAGVKVGDEVLGLRFGIDSMQDISKVAPVQNFIGKYKGHEIIFEIKRGREVLSLKMTPRQNPPTDEGPLGVGLARVAIISFPWYGALWRGVASFGELFWLTLSGLGVVLWHLIATGKLTADVYGPVGIVSVTGQVAQMGFIYLLQLTALLSLNLGIINALPFPALDGGRILFLLIEKIKGSPISQRIEKTVHSAGFVFLILLMLLVTLRDVMRLF